MEVCDVCGIDDDFKRCKDRDIVMCDDCIEHHPDIAKEHNFSESEKKS